MSDTITIWRENLLSKEEQVAVEDVVEKFESHPISDAPMPLERALAAWFANPEESGGMNCTLDSDDLYKVVDAIIERREER